VVVWTRPARGDLRQVHDYIAKDSKYYAKKVTIEITEATKKLAEFPMMGRVVPEADDSNIRELFLYSYRIVYKTIGNDVHVLAVVHCKQDVLSQNPDTLNRR